MIPTVITIVQALPMTVSGKVDANALPDPFTVGNSRSQVPADRAGNHADPVRSAVATIWARVLNVEAARLGDEPDFHRLGGDSLSLLAMLGAVAAELIGPDGEDFLLSDLAELVRTPTLTAVCDRVRAVKSASAMHPWVPASVSGQISELT